MPIDLVIDERDGPKPDLGTGDSNNNASAGVAGRSSADTTHTDGASTPDVVSTDADLFLSCFVPSSVSLLASVSCVLLVLCEAPHTPNSVESSVSAPSLFCRYISDVPCVTPV